MNFTTTLLSLSILGLVLVHYLLTKKKKKKCCRPKCTVPSGPRGHWLFGHAALPPHLWGPTMTEWAKTHGPIYEFFLMPKQPLFVVINDCRLAREMMHSTKFANRDDSDSPIRRGMNPNLCGFVGGQFTPQFKELKKFTLSALSALGFGRAAMEDKILAEADALVAAMAKMNGNGKPFDPEPYLRTAVTNVITNLIFNTRAEIGVVSPIHEIVNVVMKGLLFFFVDPLYNMCPWLMDYFHTNQLKIILKGNADLRAFIRAQFEEHDRTLREDEDPRDLIDAFVIERRKRPHVKHVTPGEIQQIVLDIFGAGTIAGWTRCRMMSLGAIPATGSGRLVNWLVDLVKWAKVAIPEAIWLKCSMVIQNIFLSRSLGRSLGMQSEKWAKIDIS